MNTPPMVAATPATMPAPTDATPGNERFSQPAVRHAILVAARQLLGHVGPYTGDVVVVVKAPDEGVEVRVKPTKDANGIDGSNAPLATADAHLLARVKQLTAHMLSPDEQKLLRDLAEHEPCSATSVADRCKPVLGKSAFWVVWGQLQGRRLVAQGDDEKYRIAADWMRGMLGSG